MIVSQISMRSLHHDRYTLTLTNLEDASLRFRIRFHLTFFDPNPGTPFSMSVASRRAELNDNIKSFGLDEPTGWTVDVADVFKLSGTVLIGRAVTRDVGLHGPLPNAPRRHFGGHVDVSLPPVPASSGRWAQAAPSAARALLSGYRTSCLPDDAWQGVPPLPQFRPRLIQDPCPMASGCAEHLIPADVVTASPTVSTTRTTAKRTKRRKAARRPR